MTSLAAVMTLVELILHPNAFQEFHPRAGNLPYFESVFPFRITRRNRREHTTSFFLTRAFAAGSKGNATARVNGPSISFELYFDYFSMLTKSSKPADLYSPCLVRGTVNVTLVKLTIY